jgi:hypothetical protein
MMPPFPWSPLKFRKAGFPRYGFKAGISGGAFPAARVFPAVGLPSPFVLLAYRVLLPALCRGTRCAGAPPFEWLPTLPQGPSLRSGLCCPGPSSLIWSHAPHSQAHHDFAV